MPASGSSASQGLAVTVLPSPRSQPTSTVQADRYSSVGYHQGAAPMIAATVLILAAGILALQIISAIRNRRRRGSTPFVGGVS
ncbi:MAG: hypothetical protein ACRDK2_09990 [Solirubrobacteraceae bacterium]